jgi:hypothetical protein
VKLHLKLNQNISKDRLRGHPKPGYEKFLKNNNFIIDRLRNNFFYQHTHGILDKIPQSGQLLDATNGNDRGSKIIALGRITQICNFALLALGVSAVT